MSPPPGVSSSGRARRPWPRRSRGPRPGRARRRSPRVAEPLERLEDAVPVGRRDAGPVVDDPQVDPVGDGAGLDADRCARRRVAEGVGDEVGDGPLEQRGIGLRPAAVDSSTATSTASVGPLRLARRRRRRPPRSRPAAGATRSAPALSRLMSSRLATSWSSRSVSSSMVSRNSAVGLGRPVDVALEQAGDRRLDRGQRRAQVVGHGPQEGGAQLVGLGQHRGRRRPRPRSRRRSRAVTSWAAKAASTRRSSAVRWPAGEDEHRAAW